MTKKEVIHEKLKNRIDKGLGVNGKTLKKEDKNLYYKIERNGGFIKTFSDMGISIKEMIRDYDFPKNIDTESIGEEEILNRLKYLKKIGDLSTAGIRRGHFDDFRLEKSMKKIYGSVQECLDSLGLDRDTKQVTKDSIIEKIKDYDSLGYDMCYSSMIKHDSALVSNATKKFNMGYNQLLKTLNIEFIEKRKEYTVESIKNRLEKVYKEEGTLRYSVLKNKDSSILFYANSHYDSFSDFLDDMGYDSSLYAEGDTLKYFGFEFEKVVKEILSSLGHDFEFNKQYSKGIRPDFQFKDGCWGDAKLSSWTQSIDSSIEKYIPNCKRLRIIFLRGVHDVKWYSDEKYEYVDFYHVSHFYNDLKKINRIDLIERCQVLAIQVESSTSLSVTTERYTP